MFHPFQNHNNDHGAGGGESQTRKVTFSSSSSSKNEMTIQATAFSKSQESELYSMTSGIIRGGNAKVNFVRGVCNGNLGQTTTHLVVGLGGERERIRRTEKLLSAIAAGSVWILPAKWLQDSALAGKFLDERKYDMGSSNNKSSLFIPNHDARCVARTSGGVFNEWKVAILTQDVALRQRLSSILRFGGAVVHPWILQHLLDAGESHLQKSLTHLLVDPEVFVDGEERSEQLRSVIKGIPVVSYVYVEELLTSAHPPRMSDFSAFCPEVRLMHAEFRLREADRPPHDSRVLGSPRLSLPISVVRDSLHLVRRSADSVGGVGSTSDHTNDDSSLTSGSSPSFQAWCEPPQPQRLVKSSVDLAAKAAVSDYRRHDSVISNSSFQVPEDLPPPPRRRRMVVDYNENFGNGWTTDDSASVGSGPHVEYVASCSGKKERKVTESTEVDLFKSAIQKLKTISKESTTLGSSKHPAIFPGISPLQPATMTKSMTLEDPPVPSSSSLVRSYSKDGGGRGQTKQSLQRQEDVPSVEEVSSVSQWLKDMHKKKKKETHCNEDSLGKDFDAMVDEFLGASRRKADSEAAQADRAAKSSKQSGAKRVLPDPDVITIDDESDDAETDVIVLD